MLSAPKPANVFNRTIQLAVTALLPLVLGACSFLKSDEAVRIDCSRADSSCHSGRFGLIWKTKTPDGEDGEAISGTYLWRSGLVGANGSIPSAYLEVNSTLGPNLGVARRNGDFFEVRAADGRVYLAKDWQTLFDLMFPVILPASALIEWMENPRDAELPVLPPNWTWENQGDRYRIRFVEADTSGRIDLIPQNFE